MRIHAQIAGECVAVGCLPTETVKALGEEAVRKLRKLQPSLLRPEAIQESQWDAQMTPGSSTLAAIQNNWKYVREIRKLSGGALLDPDDAVSEILKDEEFVIVVLHQELPDLEGHPHPIVSHRTRRTVVHTPQDSLFDVYHEPDTFVAPTETLVLDGQHLTTEDLVNCGRGLYKIKLSLNAERRIIESRKLLESIIDNNESTRVYGVTTGFGHFSSVNIAEEQLEELQTNLIRSHACGVGQPLPPSRARMLLALRINVLAKGASGVCLETVQRMIQTFNAFCVAWIPEKGSNGSGDEVPLAHLALGLIGEGQMWSPQSGWQDAAEVLAANGITPVKLKPKEGIALINGSQMITALGAEAVERAGSIAIQADVIAALTLDVLKGTTRAYDAEIHKLRPHKGQIATAARLRALLHSDLNPSQIAESHRFCNRVQDAYTLRCVPQVHGVVHDTIGFVKNILTVEMNSASDNPLVLSKQNEVLSCGNFHGEYTAKVLDYLAIATHELGQMSERRLERLVNSNLSGLPAFLAKQGGLNSGFMMVQVAAASLVSENKVLCHPSSIDSIPTNGNMEDHVSMGGFAARKVLRIVEHVENAALDCQNLVYMPGPGLVLAMELLAACQGMDLLKPLQTTAPLQEVYRLVWECVKPHLNSVYKEAAKNPSLLDSFAHSPTSSQQERTEEDFYPPSKKKCSVHQ